MRFALGLTVLILCFLPGPARAAWPVQALQQSPSTAAISGLIVDARDGTPLEKVSVRVQDTRQTTITGSDGRFRLENVPAGQHELYISAVDFILVRRSVIVTAGTDLEITIPIAAGTGTYSETVSVSAASAAEDRGSAQQTLGSNEIQQLRGLTTNDPMRAIQVLPGVAAADDLRSEFSVRALSVGNMNFTFEGVSTPLLVHTVQEVQDSGSIAMVNAEILQEITLSAGSYPQRFGNRTGAELDFVMREGSREGLRGHAGASLTDMSVVLEGPLGRSRKGSWLLSARKSYLDLIIRRLDPENDWAFGFSDAQSKLVYDLNPRHQLQLAITAGRSRLEQNPESISENEVLEGTNHTGVGVLTWRYLSSARSILTQKIAVDTNTYRNIDRLGRERGRGRSGDLLYRVNWTQSLASGRIIEGGAQVQRSTGSQYSVDTIIGQGLRVFEDFDASASSASAYGLARITHGRLTLSPGLRVDHSTMVGHTSASPWLQAQWAMSPTLLLRGAGGIYRQEPGFIEARGIRGADLDAMRSYHVDAGLEGAIGRGVTWQVSGYNREDRDYFRLPNSEFQLENGRLMVPTYSSPYRNALKGSSRGVELLLQRRSPNGLSGWVAYNLARTRYDDIFTGESFWGDFDQRHTLNLYSLYRWSDRTSFSLRFRAGSNFPAVGYYEERGGDYFLSEDRNNLRVPVYNRLDIRANRTFTWQKTRLTLFVELLNLYDRANVRAAAPGISLNSSSRYQVFGLFDTMFPRIPSVGFLLEF